MADKDDIELEVEVDQTSPVDVDLETGEVAKTEAKAEPEKEPAKVEQAEDEGAKSLREQMAQMQAARDREATARAEAEQRAKDAADRADKAERQVTDSQYQVVLSAMDAVKREGEQAEADYAKAMEEGRYADAAKAQRTMARVEGRLDQLESAKQNFAEREPKVEKTEGAVKSAAEPKQQQQVDPVEYLASQLSPASAAWVRKHPDCARDEVLFTEMVAADKRARREGIVADTPEYFSFIEKRLGFAEPEVVAKTEPDPAERRRAVPAAPVSREVPGSAPSKRSIRLTAEEQEIAEMNGMTLKEYAEQKAAYEAEKARAH